LPGVSQNTIPMQRMAFMVACTNFLPVPGKAPGSKWTRMIIRISGSTPRPQFMQLHSESPQSATKPGQAAD